MFKNHIIIQNQHIHTVLSISRPKIALFQNFLSSNECDDIIELSRSRMQRSPVINEMNNQQDNIISETRTSTGMFFKFRENNFIENIENRISELINIPIENGEAMQVLNYKIGAEYKPHHDFFRPNANGENPHTKIGGQRIATFLMYLNDVEHGGSTIFPTLGVEFNPIKGSALFFEYMNEDKTLEIHSLHGGGAVYEGEKWVATKWYREKTYNL